MKIKLTTSELYPVYVATDWTTDSGRGYLNALIEIDLPDGLWDRYFAAKGVFYELLDEVDDIVLEQQENGV